MFGELGIESILIVTVLCAIVAFFYANLGLGGGVLYVPIMDLFFPSLVMKEIVPISLVFAFATMLSSTYSHNKKKLVNFRIGATLASGGLVGVVGGVLFTSTFDEIVVKSAFATMLVIVASKMMYDIYSARKDHEVSPTEHSRATMVAGIGVSIMTGFLIGSFGIGGGVVSVPLIMYVFKFETRNAIGTSALVGAILTPAAFIAYVLNADVEATVHVDVALLLAPLILVAGTVGSKWGLQKLKTNAVKTIFTCGLYLAAGEMIYSLLT